MVIKIPRWLQVAALPVAAFLAVYVARSMSHAVFAFVMATLIALLLNPVVMGLKRAKIPRGIGASVVYLAFVGLLALVLILAVPPLGRQLHNLISRLPQFEASFRIWLRGVQEYLAVRDIVVDLVGEWEHIGDWLGSQWTSLAGRLFNVGVGVAGSLVNFVIIIITSFYMLVDGKRIFRFLAKLVPGGEAVGEVYLRGLQSSFIRYVKGQLLLGVAVGLASGLGVWILGWRVVNIWPEGAPYALLFGVWAGVTELIPYVGPWLGAFPPVLLALFHSPGAAIWVAVIYFTIQQLEGHILVPNIMGASLGVHPLVVIFAVLAGAQIAGILGMLAILPILAMIRAHHGLPQVQVVAGSLDRRRWRDLLSCEVPSLTPDPPDDRDGQSLDRSEEA